MSTACSTNWPPRGASSMLGEFDIIRRFFTRDVGARHDILVGIGDDAAVVEPGAGVLVAAVDALVDGVHFPVSTPARAIGHRALAVNLSDLAAMGATPRWATLALSLPHADANWLADFAAGFFELADVHDVALIGGDTVRGPLQVTVQILGVLDGQPLRRGGAGVGHAVYVSGSVGDAAAGLRMLSRDNLAHPLAQRFLYPQPRVELGQQLRPFASACIDISDGLACDLQRLAAACGCGARIQLEQLPLSAALRAEFGVDEQHYLALNGGDDYELCFTVAPDKQQAFNAWCKQSAQPVTCIGSLVEGAALVLMDHAEIVARPWSGFDHFAEDE